MAKPSKPNRRGGGVFSSCWNCVSSIQSSYNKFRDQYKRCFGACLGLRIPYFGIPIYRLVDKCFGNLHIIFEHFVYFLGPILILLASAIIGLLAYTFYTILMPMYQQYYKNSWGYIMVYVHTFTATSFFINVIYNYVLCVVTKNSSGPSYDLVVRQLATGTGFVYPETKEDIAQYRQEFDEKMALRMRCRRERDRNRQAALAAQGGAIPVVGPTITKKNLKQSVFKKSAEINYGTDDEEDVEKNIIGSTTIISDNKNTRRRGRRAKKKSETTTTTTIETYYSTDEDQVQEKSKTTRKKSSTIETSGSESESLQPPIPSTTQTNLAAVTNNVDFDSGGTFRRWMLLGPYEWGFCVNSNQPKPPRSHYDHVTKGLVLCLDHYCPWMFNSVGYFNYRYFVNFLFFVTTGMMYGAFISYTPFQLLSSNMYRNQLRYNRHQKELFLANHHNNSDAGEYKYIRLEAMMPHYYEKVYITLTFMLCAAVGCAVAILLFFHLYLVFTAQTTIEFHANYTNKRTAKRLGKKWSNPYDLGFKRNWEQIYGVQNGSFLFSLLPSSREPEFLPVPMLNDRGKRQQVQKFSRPLLSSLPTKFKDSIRIKPDISSDGMDKNKDHHNGVNGSSTISITSASIPNGTINGFHISSIATTTNPGPVVAPGTAATAPAPTAQQTTGML